MNETFQAFGREYILWGWCGVRNFESLHMVASLSHDIPFCAVRTDRVVHT